MDRTLSGTKLIMLPYIWLLTLKTLLDQETSLYVLLVGNEILTLNMIHLLRYHATDNSHSSLYNNLIRKYDTIQVHLKGNTELFVALLRSRELVIGYILKCVWPMKLSVPWNFSKHKRFCKEKHIKFYELVCLIPQPSLFFFF